MVIVRTCRLYLLGLSLSGKRVPACGAEATRECVTGGLSAENYWIVIGLFPVTIPLSHPSASTPPLHKGGLLDCINLRPIPPKVGSGNAPPRGRSLPSRCAKRDFLWQGGAAVHGEFRNPSVFPAEWSVRPICEYAGARTAGPAHRHDPCP